MSWRTWTAHFNCCPTNKGGSVHQDQYLDIRQNSYVKLVMLARLVVPPPPSVVLVIISLHQDSPHVTLAHQACSVTSAACQSHLGPADQDIFVPEDLLNQPLFFDLMEMCVPLDISVQKAVGHRSPVQEGASFQSLELHLPLTATSAPRGNIVLVLEPHSPWVCALLVSSV
uniref:Uncharacterized protein n=1 Tax=Knipowitschia caucasica TaxID=637954 RepID=A0AAV2IZG0_KNICA